MLVCFLGNESKTHKQIKVISVLFGTLLMLSSKCHGHMDSKDTYYGAHMNKTLLVQLLIKVN